MGLYNIKKITLELGKNFVIQLFYIRNILTQLTSNLIP